MLTCNAYMVKYIINHVTCVVHFDNYRSTQAELISEQTSQEDGKGKRIVAYISTDISARL